MMNCARESHLESSGGNLRFLDALLDEFDIGRTSRVLEIGCGTGILASYLAAITGAEVIGTERSTIAADLASQRIKCRLMHDGAIPSDDGEFDLAFCKDVLPMIGDKPAFFREVRAVLKSGGGFLTYVPEERDFCEKPLYGFIPRSRERSIQCYGHLATLCSVILDAGFANVRTYRILLGAVRIDHEYVGKHFDGFFNNTDSELLAGPREDGLRRLRGLVDDMLAQGVRLDYEWERTVVAATA